MYYMNQDAVDCFRVDFTDEDSIVAGKHYPLGTFAAEMLADGWKLAADIREPFLKFRTEFQVFLAARDPSSGGMALTAMRELWQALGRLPLYDRLLAGDHRMENLIPYLRRHPEITDEMMTPGTPRNEGYTRWMEKLAGLEKELRSFVRNTEWMLEEYFQDLPSRKRSDYLRAYARFRATVAHAMAQKRDAEDRGEVWDDQTLDLDTLSFDYPVNISLVPVLDQESETWTMAERMTFERLASFLHMDLYKGMAAGNLPRRCGHCGRWFLAEGGYDTRYCSRVAPDARGRTCRQIGAHEREKDKRKTETATREYSRIYNRLKARKRRGQITVDEWNRQVAQAQALKDTFTAGMITKGEYVEALERL